MNDGQGGKQRSPHAWAVLATIGLLSSVVVETVVVVLTLLAMHFVADWEARADRGDPIGLLLAVGVGGGFVLGIIASIVSAISFLVWLFRAVRFAHSQGWAPNSSPFGAIVCWFIPVVCWIRPYNVVRSLYRVSTRGNPGSDVDWIARWPRIFPLWWFSWLATIALRKFSSIELWDGPPVLAVGWVDWTELACSTVAASCATTILWSIQRAQTAVATEDPVRHFRPPANPSAADLDEDVDEDG